jgi:hypothetical protein
LQAAVSGATGGSVEFFDGSTEIGAAVSLSSSGRANYVADDLAVGTHSVTAEYFATGATSATSTSTPVPETVNAAPTRIAVVAPRNPLVAGSSISFTATVSSRVSVAGIGGQTGVPAGTVTFTVTNEAAGSTPITGTVAVDASGNATFTPSTSLAAGTYDVTATFTPADGDYSASSSTKLVEKIVPASGGGGSGGGSGGSTAVTSSNWSGYAAATNLNNPQSDSVTDVSGTWTVPTATASSSKSTAYSSVWVGIDGYNSSSVEQIGTDSDVVNGKATYYVWYEMYPQASSDVTGMTISAGDTISASVQYLASGSHAGQFELSITDTSRANDSFTIYENGSGLQRSSAEWIVEAPSSNSGVLPLANFG